MTEDCIRLLDSRWDPGIVQELYGVRVLQSNVVQVMSLGGPDTRWVGAHRERPVLAERGGGGADMHGENGVEHATESPAADLFLGALSAQLRWAVVAPADCHLPGWWAQ